MTAKTITIANLEVSNEKPFTLFAGMNVLGSRELALKIAEEFKLVTDELKLPFVFKASFDKANRSSINSFRGPGLDEGLKWLAEIKETFGVGTLIATPSSLPFKDGMISPIAFDAPVDVGTMD